MKRINIYLNAAEKEELNKIGKKYKVSLSTIADKVCFYTYKILHEDKTETTLMDEYIKKGIEKNTKTSIKPKCYAEDAILTGIIKNKDLFTTNCLKIYANREIKKYVKDEKLIQQYYNNINSALMECKEQFYNYNNFIRSNMRAFRENKEYYKRKIAEMEG